VVSSRRSALIVSVLAALGALVVYWKTAYPTITWWDSSSYSLAAKTLGVTNPPGSLLLTLLGWLATRLPVPLPDAQKLNLLAGVLAAIAVALVVPIAVRIRKILLRSSDSAGVAATVGTGIGALAFAFGLTLWEHAIKFTPYVLTAVFTALILLTLVRWWENADLQDSWRWLLLLAFLFGLDFSVHRTNALLMPGALAWILVRRPQVMRQWRTWAGGVAGLVAGLSLHLIVMPISDHTTSPLNMFQPDGWKRFWDYVSLAQTGGNFQIAVWPRKSALWSNQVMDLVRVFSANFAHRASTVGVAGWLPLVAGAGGIAFMLRRSRRFAVAFVLLWVLQAAATVLYFNIPANYFRSLDRHYLPVLVTFAVAVSLGTGTAMAQLSSFVKRQPVLATAAAVALLVLPAVQLRGNWAANDASRRYFARDYALNSLLALPPNAFYITVGDNDTFPVMYLQTVEGIRPDVRIVNLSLANTDWYVDQMRRRHPDFPVHGTSAERRRANAPLWKDSTLVVRFTVADSTAIPTDATRLDSVVFRIRPPYGGDVLPADDVVLDMVRAAGFETPVTVSLTAGSSGLGWLQPNARIDGLHWRLVPDSNPKPDTALLRENLLGKGEFRGYADSTVVLDDVTITMGYLYREAFRSLGDAEFAAGHGEECRNLAGRVDQLIPPTRLSVAGRPAPPRVDWSCAR
jgi:preprotein translocase subunit SecG